MAAYAEECRRFKNSIRQRMNRLQLLLDYAKLKERDLKGEVLRSVETLSFSKDILRRAEELTGKVISQ